MHNVPVSRYIIVMYLYIVSKLQMNQHVPSTFIYLMFVIYMYTCTCTTCTMWAYFLLIACVLTLYNSTCIYST